MAPLSRRFPSIFRLRDRVKYMPLEDAEVVYPVWPPANPRQIVKHQSMFRETYTNRKYRAPEGIYHDSPLYALYRIYECILTDDRHQLRNEVELFWAEESWSISEIPDPEDEADPERYAVLACVPALLAECFNKRIAQGLPRGEPALILALAVPVEDRSWLAATQHREKVPAWTRAVPPLTKPLYIPHSQPHRAQLSSWDDEDASQVFKEKHILTLDLDIPLF